MALLTKAPSIESKFHIRIVSPEEVDQKLIAAWSDLEARAIEPNAFLSPYFVLPAIRHLEEDKHPLLVFVESNSGENPTLKGFAIFNVHRPSRKFPLQHLVLFSSIHSYLDGFLVDRTCAADVLHSIFSYISEPGHGWHGIRFKMNPLSDEQDTVATELGMKWKIRKTWQRAIMHPGSAEMVLENLSKSLKRNYQRYTRALQALGKLEWRMLQGRAVTPEMVSEFLRLEHMSWKGEGGTSLLSNPNQTEFFKEMVSGFNSESRFYFTVLLLDEKPIAFTSNLISGSIGFGFKLCFDPAYAKYSPSIINLIEYCLHANDNLPGIDYVDSSASPGSYMESVWQDRRTLVDGYYSSTPVGRAALSIAAAARSAKRLIH
jgi:CelD/BcsL family acetyltransferase involved in cellulose biosynthesis